MQLSLAWKIAVEYLERRKLRARPTSQRRVGGKGGRNQGEGKEEEGRKRGA